MSESAGAPASRVKGQLQVGQRLGNYRIVQPLGHGGMGAVFEAMHQYIERKAAVKVLHPDLSQNPQFASRFLNEARAVNLIKHPGLVEIFEFGLLDDGTAYIVMEFLAGTSLREHLRLSAAGLGSDALPICRQIAHAMVAAHQKGIVHRDLKPENVMLVPDAERPDERRVKVLDFGIAKLSQQASAADGRVQTETGAMIGTPAYMAPEQCLADPSLDGKADVYALGIMLYEMLAARLPFAAQHSFDFMSAHVRESPRPLEQVAPHVPPEVANLVHSMLAKTPGERPSMEAVVAILDQLHAALSTTWTIPRISGALPQISAQSLLVGATALGPTIPSPRPSARPSRELIELGATVSAAPTPSGQRKKDALPPANASARSLPPGAPAQLNSLTPLPAVAAAMQISELTPRADALAIPPAAAEATKDAELQSPLRTRRRLGAVLTLLLACGAAAVVVGRLGAHAPTPPSAPRPSPPPRGVKWIVHSIPPGAEVLRADGQIVGATPWQLERAAGSGETTIRVHHAGYQDKTVVLNHDTDVNLELRLEALPVVNPNIPAAAEKTDAAPIAKHPRVRRNKQKSEGNEVQLLLD